MEAVSFSDIKAISSKCSLNLISFTDLKPPHKSAERLLSWQKRGFAGDLKYMQRDPEIYLSATRLLPSAKSLLIFGVPYTAYKRRELQRGYGRVARYALSKDYHDEIPIRLSDIVKGLKEYLSRDFAYRICTDAIPFLERAFAEKSGLGFIGKNTLLIKPKVGSYFFLAEMLVDFQVLSDGKQSLVGGGCGTCTRCLSQCPTQALVEPYVLDARRCISYLTIEKRGSFTSQEKALVKEWVFRCDVCQEVCPWNHKKDVDSDNGQISLDEIFALKTNREFQSYFDGSPILRARRPGLIRNAICVAVHERWGEFVDTFHKLLQDDSEIVRETAQWGIDSFKEVD